MAALLWVALARRWSATTPVIYFVASMVPFGFIYIEHKLRQEAAEVGATESG